ncbi:MAG: restriction endonuclease [Pseudomonadota bacterium]
MTIFEFPMGDETLRPQDDIVQRILRDELSFSIRVAEYERTGRHPFSLDVIEWKYLWKSTDFPSGASAELVDLIDANVASWATWLHLDATEQDALNRSPLIVSDRVRVNNGLWWGTPLHLYSHARQLSEPARAMLARCSFAFAMTANDDPLQDVKVAALVEHRAAFAALVSQNRFWRVDGTLNAKKMLKVLRDEVSPLLGTLTTRQLETVGMQWKANGSSSVISSTAHGLSFEGEVRDVLVSCGFDVESTAISGDFGVDLIVKEANFKLAIQVKNFAGTVGVTAIQEVTAGALHYGCTHTLVVASNGFTESARILARSTGTRLETLHSLRQHLREQFIGRIMTSCV